MMVVHNFFMIQLNFHALVFDLKIYDENAMQMFSSMCRLFPVNVVEEHVFFDFFLTENLTNVGTRVLKIEISREVG